MLPIQVSRASANITAAIVLRAEAGIGLQKTPVTKGLDFAATVSASLTLAELTFGAVLSDGSCRRALFLDVDSNAAAEARVGGEVAGREFDHGPEVSTVFLSAGTTTCLDARTDVETVTTTSSKTAATLPACPATALVTRVRNVTKTLSLTSCLVSAINCPRSLSQVVLVTDVQPATTTLCPSLSANTTTNATAPAVTVAAVPFYTAGTLPLPPLAAPVVTSVAPGLLANATAPVNATVAGVAVAVPVLTTTPPPAETTALVNVGGRNATSEAGGGVGRGRGGGRSLMGFVGVVVGGLVLL